MKTKFRKFEIVVKDKLKKGRVINDTIDMKMLIEMQLEFQKGFLKSSKPDPLPMKSSVKLPKFKFCPFNGDKLKWVKFWQSLETSVQKNDILSNIEKFNYLRNKLSGDAKVQLQDCLYQMRTTVLRLIS